MQRPVKEEGIEMQEAEQLISLYHTGFIVCLCLAVLSAILSIVLFFVLDIRGVFDFMTGRAEKRTIRKMQEENAKTGKLREEYHDPGSSDELYRTPSGSIPPVIYPVTEPANTGTEKTEKMYQTADAGSEETTLLAENAGDEETTLLNSGEGSFGETVLLTPELEQTLVSAEEEKEKQNPSRKFIITKENIWIHTNELI